jgi:hypothetical protein
MNKYLVSVCATLFACLSVSGFAEVESSEPDLSTEVVPGTQPSEENPEPYNSHIVH